MDDMSHTLCQPFHDGLRGSSQPDDDKWKKKFRKICLATNTEVQQLLANKLYHSAVSSASCVYKAVNLKLNG